MSRAGVNSSIGDEYQELVATYWATNMLSDADITKIEIDATSLSPSGYPFFIDDIVISHQDGHTICCQCKKNRPKHNAWSANSLKDELEKAWKQWRSLPDCSIRFYSQDNFGNLARISDRVRIHDDLTSFNFELPEDLRTEFKCLTALGIEEDRDGNELRLPTEDETLRFMNKLSFDTFPDKIIRESSQNMLRYSTTFPERAFEEIQKKVCYSTRRSNIENHDQDPTLIKGNSITRDNLCRFLRNRGFAIVPLKEEMELWRDLNSISSIGRNWPRKIHGQPIKRKETGRLLELVKKQEGMILLLGEPGSGKTCILLDLLEMLEKDGQIYPVFIQARDVMRDAFISNDFADNVARMAEYRQVVVVADSLDVLSISRDSASLSFFLSLLLELKSLNNVSVIASCRTFDYKYDVKLSSIEHSASVTVAPLDYETEVVSLLQALAIGQDKIAKDQKSLLTNPRMLSMYIDLIYAGGETEAASWIELSEVYLRTLVLQDPNLGDEAYDALKNIAAYMLKKRRLDIPQLQTGVSQQVGRCLKSAKILIETERGNYTFAHQSMVDLLCVAQAMENGKSMVEFILSIKPVPFIRPTIRSFFFYLRNHDPKLFRKQIRALLNLISRIL